MLTSVEVENFKGIQRRTPISIRPITLLFGPNSAGKSTILAAISFSNNDVVSTGMRPTFDRRRIGRTD